MNDKLLSERLKTVANFVPVGSSVADIGSDHAYLPCYLMNKQHITFAIAGEVNEGPYQSAVNQVKRSGFTREITVRKGNGLEVLSPGEVDVITIAGMGGQLIRDILLEGREKLANVKRLVLQPNVAAHLLRERLSDLDWELVDECILEEDHKVYEVLVFDAGNGKRPYEGMSDKELRKSMLVGPILLKNQNEAFRTKWQNELTKRERILTSLTKTHGVSDKEAQVKNERDIIKEVLS
ncbi:tRNA (adenine(22)-N(1))-methyltransferase TrmK [Bacillus hwajinpoensis]|uniref:tRNA (Adenine(22)-N(1))-methyltransferase TrmK n=1 Tax=Guptibacillus hwajinpoensis TaxID=208199 RepID=A0A845EWZ4_9BACL|nr:tRNA (adenine(22)-N(1))-methyltransferase TrmK [Pseudalkalibacillus hwajinpoensis]MYL63044.1 tRNA (adenine(22)-N(1))-methyltransferase TrmK [Pseudalkalibacillus hwajinpoensis]